MEERKKGSGTLVVILCALYIFCLKGGFQAQYAVYGYQTEMLGISLVQLGAAGSVFSIIGVACSVIAAPLYKKFSPKVFMVISPIFIALFGFLYGNFQGVMPVYAANIFASIACSIGAIMAISAVLVNWFGKDAATRVAICIGFQSIGGGTFQTIAGQMYTAVGIESIFRILIPVCMIVALAAALLVKVKPNDYLKVATVNGPTKSAEKAKPANLKNFYKSPAVWLFFLASLTAYFCTSVLSSFFTKYFPQFGAIDVATAATWLSAMTIIAGLWNIFGAKFTLKKFGIRVYVFLIHGCVFVACGLAILYAKMPSIILLAVIVITGAIATTCYAFYAIAAPQLFPQNSVEAVTKGEAANRIGGIIGPTVVNAVIASSVGYTGGFTMCIIAAALSMVIYSMMFILEGKKGKQS